MYIYNQYAHVQYCVHTWISKTQANFQIMRKILCHCNMIFSFTSQNFIGVLDILTNFSFLDVRSMQLKNTEMHDDKS